VNAARHSEGPGRWRRRAVRLLGGAATAGAVAVAAAAVLMPPPASAEGQPAREIDRVSGASRAARDGPMAPPALRGPPDGQATAALPAGAVGSSPAVAPDPCRRRAGPARPVALNSAGRAELEELPGIGPAKAQKILDWRAKHGRFRRILDLRRVNGFGRKTVMRLAPYLVLDPPPAPPTPTPRSPSATPPSPSPQHLAP
jgi:competence protein ComEA